MLRTGLKFLLKDALRGARYSVRRSTQGAPPIDFPGRSHLTKMADDLLSTLEETVVSLRYGSDLTDDMIRTAMAAYPRLRDTIETPEFAAAFAATNYRLTKAVLARRGIDTVFVSELAYTQAADQIASRTPKSAGAWSPARFAAEVTLALIAFEPVRRLAVGQSDHPVLAADPNGTIGFTIGLAVTAWLTKRDVSAVDCVASADDLVGVAYDRLSSLSRGDVPGSALASTYDELALLLP